MKTLFISLNLWIWSCSCFAGWTDQKPTEALLMSYDQKCANFREPNGNVVRVKKESLKKIELQPRKTKIEYFPESLLKNQCNNSQ